jgi:hypothetical protein
LADICRRAAIDALGGYLGEKSKTAKPLLTHHVRQESTDHGHPWWKLDLPYPVICLLEGCGLAYNVVPGKPTPEAVLT